MKPLYRKLTGSILLVAAYFFLMGTIVAHAATPVKKIAILPVYIQSNGQVTTFDGLKHSKRMARFINNWQLNDEFEIVDLFGRNKERKQINRMIKKAKNNYEQFSNKLCQQYGLDAAIFVIFDIKGTEVSNGSWKIKAHAFVDGFEHTGRSLQIADDKYVTVINASLDTAVNNAEKELGLLIGKELFAQLTQRNTYGYTRNTYANQSMMTLRLEGADNDAVVEVFEKVLHTVKGVESVEMLNQQLIARQPRRCFATWQIAIDPEETSPFRLRNNINKVINDILDAGGYIKIKGMTFRYTPSEIKLLNGFRFSQMTPTFILFVIDPAKARARNLSTNYYYQNRTWVSNHHYPRRNRTWVRSGRPSSQGGSISYQTVVFD